MMLSDIVKRFERPRKQADGSYMVHCPSHQDKQASLHISQGIDGRILMYCHAGCAHEDILAAAGLSQSDLFHEPATQERREVAVYQYKDENGNVLYETVRYDPKDFRQRVPDGVGGYSWSLKGVRRVLYNLPALKPAIQAGKHILFVEGEKDADAFIKHGIAATTSPMGAGKFLSEYAESLRGAIVDLIPDNDEAGRKHMYDVAAKLYGIAKEIRIIDPCSLMLSLPEKGDISDVIKELGFKEASRLLLDNISFVAKYAPEKAVYCEPDPTIGERTNQGRTKGNGVTSLCLADLKTISAAGLAEKCFDALAEPVSGLVVEGLTLLVGASKIGKSWLVLSLCLAVAGGHRFLNRDVMQGNVLYLALEDSQRRLQDRQSTLCADRQALEHLDFCTDASTLDSGLIEAIEKWISTHAAARLIVIDTLQKIRGIPSRNMNAYQADYEMMGRIKKIADMRHLAIVLVHHTNKCRIVNDSFDKVNGSTGLMGAADTTILIERDRSEKQATVHVVGRDVYCDDFIINFDGGAWSVIADNATAYAAEQEYAANPMVQLLRKIVAENPNGGRFPYERLTKEGMRLLGESPFIDARDFSKKLKKVRDELFRRDGIEVDTNVDMKYSDNDGDKRRGKGVKLTIRKPMVSFQGCLRVCGD